MSTQLPIDLLPEPIRKRCQAGARTGRYIAAVVAAIIVVVLAATHFRIEQDRVAEQLAQQRQQAAMVLEIQAKADRLRDELRDIETFIELHNRIADPVNISTLLATMIAQLPDSVTIDRIDLDTSRRRGGRASRSRSDDEPEVRMMHGEIAGVALADEHIAELVDRLDRSMLFDGVSLDFSRGRQVRDQSAREFRLSFRVDLSRRFELVEVSLAELRTGVTELE